MRRTAAVGVRKLTYYHYALTPEDRRYELVDGELYMTPAPVPFHQIVSRRIQMALALFVEEHSLGEVLYAPCDVYLSLHDVVQPDILFVARERLGIIKDKYIQGAPDLVVEILSPTRVEWDREVKLGLYGRHGVREYWIADPEARSIEIYLRRQRKFELNRTAVSPDVLESPTLRGFRFPLRDVFKKIGH